MDEAPAGIRRVCIAVTFDRSSYNLGLSELGGRLRTAFIDACVAAELPRVLLTPQRDGGALVALLPVGIDEPKVLAALTAKLSAHIRVLNHQQRADQRLRVAVAVHEGITILDTDGYRGPAITKACRLVTSDAARDALAANSSADVIVLLSERIFYDASRIGVPGLHTRKCRRVEIYDAIDGHRDIGWIYIPLHVAS